MPDPPTGFKRIFVVPGIVLTLCEAALVVLPLLSLFRPSVAQTAILLRVGVPLIVAAHVLWFVAMASWLSPVQRGVSALRRGEALDGKTSAAAYHALRRLPWRALWLRTGLWIVLGTVGGLLLSNEDARR